jgi:hypothetical protein
MCKLPTTFRRLGAALLLFAATAVCAQSNELAVTFRKPDVDLKKYSQLLIMPLNLSDTRVIPPPWVENAKPHEWQLTKKNEDVLRSAYAGAVRAGIETSGDFKVVDRSAPGVLQVEVRLISLTPWAARGEQATTLGSGSLTFEAHVRDASTGELLAVLNGTQPVGNEYQENTDFNRVSTLKEHFTNWGRNVSRRLTAARTQ